MNDNIRYDSLGPGFEEPKSSRGKIPVWVMAFLLGALLLAGVSMMRFPQVLKDYKCYRRTEQRMHTGETADALYDLLEVVEKHSNSVPMITELIDLSMEAGYYDLAAYVFDTYLVGKEVSDIQYVRMTEHMNRLDAYYNTYDRVDQLAGELLGDSDSMSEEEVLKAQAEMSEAIRELLDEDGQDKAMIYYYLGLFCSDEEERYQYLRLGYEEEAEFYDIRVQLANAARRRGDLEEARRYLEESLRKEKEDTGALRGMAILSMLEGNLQEGMDLAKRAYELAPEGTYVRDTYLVALYANGRQEEAEALAAEMGDALQEDTKALLSGECSLADYYMGE